MRKFEVVSKVFGAPAEIAPLFRRAVSMANIWLPARFWAVLRGVE